MPAMFRLLHPQPTVLPDRRDLLRRVRLHLLRWVPVSWPHLFSFSPLPHPVERLERRGLPHRADSAGGQHDGHQLHLRLAVSPDQRELLRRVHLHLRVAYDAVSNRTVQTRTITSTLVTTCSRDAANRLSVISGQSPVVWDSKLRSRGGLTHAASSLGRPLRFAVQVPANTGRAAKTFSPGVMSPHPSAV